MVEEPKFIIFESAECLTIKTRDSLFRMGKYIKRLKSQAKALGLEVTAPVFTIYYEKPENPKDVDYEVFLPVNLAIKGKTKTIESVSCGSIRIKGSINQFDKAYTTLIDYINDHNSEIIGPLIVVYVKGPLFGLLPRFTMITDFYFPLNIKCK